MRNWTSALRHPSLLPSSAARSTQWLGPSIILVIGARLYRGYLSGARVPNFDFLSSYLTAAYGWWGLGGFFHPPRILPFVLGGTPAYLDVQNSSWYLPVGLVAQTVGLDPHSAAVLQAVSICFGALGMYALCRVLGLGMASATLAGVAYLFAPGFISNAEHVDIVRAWAFLPWLLLALTIGRRGSWWKHLLGVGLWFQFFVGAYPGNIASAVYICLTWLLVMLVTRHRHRRLSYLLSVGSVLVPGVLLASLKWLPYLFSSPGHGVANQVVFNADILATLVFPFEGSGLPNDISMRSFYVVPVLLVLAFFFRPRSTLAWAALSCLVVSVLLGVDTNIVGHWQERLPLLDISRFRTTDFKVGVVIAIILLGASGAQELIFGRSMTLTRSRLRQQATLAAGFFTVLCGIAATGTFDHASVRSGGKWLVISALAVLVAAVLVHLSGRRPQLPALTALVLLLLTSTWSGVSSARLFENGWNADRVSTERLYWGDTFDHLASNQGPIAAVRRPARSAPTFPSDSASALTFQSWNAAEISRHPSLGGGVNLKGQARYEQLQAMSVDPAGAPTMAALTKPGRGWVMTDPNSSLAKGLPTCVVVDACLVKGASVHPTSWQPSRIVFGVTTPMSGLLVINEVAWPGWTVTTCDAHGRQCADARAVDTHDFLIAKSVRAGDSQVIFAYKTPRADASWSLFWAGVALALVGAASPLLLEATMALARRKPRLSVADKPPAEHEINRSPL